MLAVIARDPMTDGHIKITTISGRDTVKANAAMARAFPSYTLAFRYCRENGIAVYNEGDVRASVRAESAQLNLL